MRLLMDTLIALLLVGILAAVLFHQREQQLALDRCQSVRQALGQLENAVLLHAGLGDVKKTAAGYPVTIAEDWFHQGLPRNVYASPSHPWLDIAAANDDSDNPADPILNRPDQAQFWYNANSGVFRARIPTQFSDQSTLALYNRVNGTALLELPAQDAPDEDGRAPAFTPRSANAPKASHPVAPKPAVPHRRPTLVTQG